MTNPKIKVTTGFPLPKSKINIYKVNFQLLTPTSELGYKQYPDIPAKA